MSSDQKITAGRLEHVKVCDVLEAIDRPPPSKHQASITGLDSTMLLAAPLDKSLLLKRYAARFQARGTALAPRTSTLLKINRMTRIFIGFDEVFFFAKRPALARPARLIHVDPNLTADDVPPRSQHWFAETDCYLGIGDGTGLSFFGRMVGRIPKNLMQTVGERVSS